MGLLTELRGLEPSSGCWNGLGLSLPSKAAGGPRMRDSGWMVPGFV